MKYNAELIVNGQTNETIYKQVSKQLSNKIGLKLDVIDTHKTDKQFCDKYSIYVNDDLQELIYYAKDKNTIKALFDDVYTVNGSEYYIEPYNARLLNLAKL